MPFGLLSMAVFRIPLMLRKKITFFKLMGCGKNGTFDIHPEWRQWAILTVHTENYEHNKSNKYRHKLYGSLIMNWLKLFSIEQLTLILQPITGHGTWDGNQVFGEYQQPNPENAMIATLTRATIRLSKLGQFWRNVPLVADKISTADGLLFSLGIGEVPFTKQATFSVWETPEQMKHFAYSMKAHSEVIKKTRAENWYSEEMFVRFNILDSFGTIHGINPMKINQ